MVKTIFVLNGIAPKPLYKPEKKVSIVGLFKGFHANG